MQNKLFKSKKYAGVYYKETPIDRVYYIAYKNSNGNYSKYKIGTKTSGITESYCYTLRQTEINKIRLGEDPKLSSKKSIILFDEIAQDYLKKQQQEKLAMLTANTNRYYRHIYPIFKNKNIKDITSQDIIDFKHYKLKTYKPATVYWFIGFIGSIFFHAINRTGKFKGINPAYGVFTKKEFNNKRKRWLNYKEIALLLDTIEQCNHPMKFYVEMFIRISLSTGARVNSVLDLLRSDINLDTREIRLYDAKNKEYYLGYLSSKMVPQDKLELLLKDQKSYHQIFYYKNHKIYIKKIQRVTYPIFKELFNQDISNDDETNKVCLHTLRHSMATLAVQNSDIFLTQKLLNHKDINQTLRYAKIDEQRKKDAIDKMF